MDVIGSEIGLKMRSAIKAKLTELGCYVDDELPDYVMVMVANKRTRPQMEEDLHLFLAGNTASFVAWLYQVLQKLQEVTVTTPPVETRATSKDRTRSTSKEPKIKEKKTKDKKAKIKDKHKKNDVTKKTKKKDKEKIHRKRVDKKSHKHKKKSKDTELIRPNVPPLLMNPERESEPSITDVFAGQILKNHGENLAPCQGKTTEVKPEVIEVKRAILPIIDPATISAAPNLPAEPAAVPATAPVKEVSANVPQDKLQEINEIEEKIHDLRRKLAKQLNSMSDDEDFLNIRAGPEELLPELADDVFQEINAARSLDVRTPPLNTEVIRLPSPVASNGNTSENARSPVTEVPQIELRLPKRSARERLGVREETKIVTESKKTSDATLEKKEDRRMIEIAKDKLQKNRTRRLGRSHTPEPDAGSKHSAKPSKKTSKESERNRKNSSHDIELNSEKYEPSAKRKSPVSRAAPASVVTVRQRGRAGRAPASQLLFRAVADAQKSLLNIPPKIDTEPISKRIGLRPPAPAAGEGSRLTIQVSGTREGRRVLQPAPAAAVRRDHREREESKERRPAAAPTAVGGPLITRFINTDYVPKLLVDEPEPDADTAFLKRADIHNAKVASEEGPVFLVTLEGLDPNQFLTKKLQREGIEGDILISKTNKKNASTTEISKPNQHKPPDENSDKSDSSHGSDKKRLSDTSEESDTQVIIKAQDKPPEKRKTLDEKRESVDDKRKTVEDKIEKRKSSEEVIIKEEIKTEGNGSPPVKKRRKSPIVFDVEERARRARTVSNGSDSNTVVLSQPANNKYDSLPSLSSAADRKAPCRTFPLCRFGAKCLFTHPPCKFAAACTRRNCMYSHLAPAPSTPPSPYIASHVVPAPNYKSITATPAPPSMCKYYPNCANPTCHYYHPKPCRFGKACVNRSECNFYHHDAAGAKWRSAV